MRRAAFFVRRRGARLSPLRSRGWAMRLGKWSLGGVSAKFALLSAILLAGAVAWMMLPEPSGAENDTVFVTAPGTGLPERAFLAQSAAATAEPVTTEPASSATVEVGEHETTGTAPAAQPVTVERAPIDGLKIASQSFRRGGLGSKALVTLTLRNANDYPVKDIEIACAFARADGSHVTDRKRVIADTISQKSRKTYAGMLIGFVNINANKAKCSLVTASRI
jgi:hypothetical protein